MRLYISILAALGLTVGACGKKEEPKKPEQAAVVEPEKKEEPTKVEPEKKEEPVKAEADAAAPAADAQAAAADAAAPAAPVDRAAVALAGLEAYAKGDIEASLAQFADDAVWYSVGSPEHPETKGKAAIIEAMKATPKLGDAKMKAGRVIESGDFVVVEYVAAGKATTKAEDGTETSKDVAIPMALLAQFNADGKVVAAWHFRDQVGAAQQMGAMPGLPEGFQGPALAETTDVVKGDGNAAIKDLYTTFFGKVATPDNIDGAVAEHVADDFTMYDGMYGKTLDKAGLGAWIKGYTGMFGGLTVTVDNAVMAGDYAAFVVTNKATYKGGIPGVEAKDQAVSWKSLDVVKVKDGKFASFATYFNTMDVLVQLGAVGGAAEKPADAEAAPSAFGVASCDTFVNAMRACLEKVPEAGRAMATDAFNKSIESWKGIAAQGDAAKGALETACKSALDAAKQGMSAMCPDVKWE